jgi:Uma2 family endonuclease
MSTTTQLPAPQVIVYPDSDGRPMADNTLQFQYIVTIQGGLDALFRDDPNVFVAGDLLWYPVEGEPTIRMAPDVMVVLGRQKGYRGSYQQWLEGGIAPQVVFEVLSPGNRAAELIRKFRFYERYGVDEYYLYDPDGGELTGYLRSGEELREIPSMVGWVSPRLKVRFELEGGELRLCGPDGRRFATYVELAAQRDREQQEKEQAQQRAEQQAQRAERLAEQLRALGVEPQS